MKFGKMKFKLLIWIDLGGHKVLEASTTKANFDG